MRRFFTNIDGIWEEPDKDTMTMIKHITCLCCGKPYDERAIIWAKMLGSGEVLWWHAPLISGQGAGCKRKKHNELVS